jgi:hypothetical protein
MLNGIAFAASGLSQLSTMRLVASIRGTCHMMVGAQSSATDEDDAGCYSGHWRSVHVAETILLGGLLLAPYLAHKERLRKRDQTSELPLM